MLSGEAGDKSGKGQREEDRSLTVVLHQWSSSGIWVRARLRNDNRGPGTLGAASDRTVTQCLCVNSLKMWLPVSTESGGSCFVSLQGFCYIPWKTVANCILIETSLDG